MVGVLHACAEEQPRLAVTRKRNHLAHHALVLVLGVDRCLKLCLDVLATSLVDSFGGQLELRHLAAQVGQEAFVDQLLDADGLEQRVEQGGFVGDQAVA